MSKRIRVLVRAVVLLTMATASSSAFCANVTFTGGGGNQLWNNSANWDTNTVPGSSDIAFISNGADSVLINVSPHVHSIRIQNGATVTIQSGKALTQDEDSVVDAGSTLVIDGGTFLGLGTLFVVGTIDIQGGTLGGTAPMIIYPAGVLQFSAATGSSVLLRNTFNSGTINFLNTIQSGLHFGVGTTQFVNNGVIDIQTDHDIVVESGTPILTNDTGGTIRKSAGINTAAIRFKVDNAAGATIEAQSGTLALDNGGAVRGQYSISSGAHLHLSGGTFTMLGNAALTGPGTLHTSGASLALNAGTFTMTGNPAVSGSVSIGGGTLDAGAGVDVTWTNVTLSSGTITGAGDLHVSGNFNWLGGTILGLGARVLDPSSTPTISCTVITHCNIDGATLQMNASGTFNATTNSLVFFNGANLIIASGKTLDITTDGTIVGLGTITNNGTITKSGGTGIRSIGTVLHNNGSVIVTAGGLSLLGNGTHSGSFTVTAPGTMAFDGGAHTIAGGISGTGSLVINGATVTLNSTGNVGGLNMSGGTLGGSGTLTLANGGTWTGGTMSGSGTTAVAAGKTLTVSNFPTLNGRALDLGTGAMLDLTGQRLDVGSAANVTGSGALRVNGGTLRVLSGVTQTIPNLTLTTGIIDGAGDLHVSGNFNWLGGTISGSGARVLDNSSTPAISCSTGNCLLDGATLRLQASGTYSASSNALMFSNGASLILAPGQTLNVTNDGDFISGVGAPGSIVVGGLAMGFNGCIWKTTTSGTSIIGVPVTMSGSFKVDAGTMQVASDVTAAAGAIVHYSVGATLEVTGGEFLFTSGAVSFPANGDFKVSAGTLRVPTGVTITMPNVTLEGSGFIDGGGTLIVSGTGNWFGGTMGSAAAPGGITRIDSGNGLNVTPVSAASLTQARQLLNNGTLSYGSVDPNILTMSGNSKITNNGALNFNDGTIGLSGSALIENFGTMTKVVGTGTTGIIPPVDNHSGGTISAPTGTIALSGGGIAAGEYATISGAALTLAGGSFTVAATATVTGAGTLSIAGATLDAASGTDLTVPDAVLSAGTITGAGTVRVGGNFTWSGGTMSGSGTTINPATKSLAITAPVTLASRTLQNAGTLTVSGDVTGSGTIDNQGTLNAVADLTLGAVLNNSGQVTTSNALSLTGGGTHTGTFTVTTPGNLSFSSGTHTVSGGGSIGGTGTLTFSGATATVGVPVTVAALNVTAGTATLDANATADAFMMNGGTLGGSGILTLSNGGTWSGGTMSGSGTTVNPAAKALTVSAPVTLTGRTLQNAGTLTVSGDVTGSGTIDNSGTLNAAADLTLGVTVNNSGQVATSNALSLAGGGTHTGSFNVTTPGNLSFSSGTHTVSGGGSITGTGTLMFSGATATVGAPVAVGALNVTAGTATLDANATAGAFTMNGGTLGGSGILTLSNGGTWSGGAMSGSGSTVNPAAKTLSVSAPVTLNSRTLQNAGTLTVGGDITGSGTIDNSGTLSAAADLTLGVTVNNSGQVATSNALSLAGGGTHTGSFTVTTPGNLSFSSGTHTVSGGGSIAGTGTLTFSGATATVGVPVTVGALNVTAGTATLDASASADAFTMTGGTLGGSGSVTLNNGGTWSGGTWFGGPTPGTGTTINPATKTLSIAAPVTLNSRTLQNNGTLSVNGNVAGSGTIANNGTLDVLGNSTIGAALNNSGQIATSEILSLGGNGAHNGTFTTTATGVIDFSGGTQTISGTLAGTGTIRFSGAAATVSGTWSGMPIEVAGGGVALDTNGTIPALTLTGGTLAGSGDVTVSGPSNWSGGMIAGNGALTFGAGATVTMPGSSAVTLARPLLNQGTIDFTAASNGMLIDGVAVTNDGTLDIQSSQAITATAGTPPFVNHGILKRTSGSGVMLFAPPLSNSGQVRIESGTMQFGATYAQSAGTTTILSGATLQTATLALNGGSLTGNGTVVGTVANHAIVSPGASPGTLTIDGDYVQSPNAALEIELGGTTPGTEYDRLLVSGSATLGGTLNVTTINGFIPAPGNAFQIVTFGSLLATFAVTNGLIGPGAVLVATTGSTDLQLVANQIEANLAINVSAPPSAAHGSTFAYTVNVFNGGNVDANGVSLTATLPPNVTFTGATPSICSGAPNLVCSIGALLNGSTATVVIDVTAGAAGAAPITVLATAGEFDSNPANNSASASTIITQADVAAAVTGPVSTTAGTKAIYTVTVSNNGPDTATNVAVTATASPGLTFSGNSGACAGSFPCTLATLSSGQHATIYTAWDIAPSATGSVQLTVNASSADDANTSNDSASAITTIGNCPTITIVAPGEMTARSTAEAVATPFDGATYSWAITGGTIDSGDGTPNIVFTAGEAGTASLAVNVTGGACTLGAAVDVTVKPPTPCVGTASPTAPADGTTADAVVTFTWTAVPAASGYRLWLQEGDAPPRNLGTALGISRTKIIPPGSFRWYVETLFDGCASHESERLALTILPGQDCASHGAPQLSAPANETPATSAAVAFSWNAEGQALEYELWLAPSGGVPTLIRTTTDTSCTAVVPPGRLEWYVRAVFGGCASTESAHRVFTYTPPPECASQRPLLIAPVERERLTSPVSFEWTSVPGAASYELYVDDVLAATTTSPQASDLPLPLGERRWHVRAHLAESCGALDSAESRLIVIAPPPSCEPLGVPVVSAPAQISSGTAGRIQWSFVAGATLYVVETAGDPRFPRASTSSFTVSARQLPFTFTNSGSAPVARYVRVHAIDTNCVQPVTGEFSPVAVVSVLPPASSAGVALLTDPTDVPYTLSVAAELAGQSFTATPTVPWITVTPASGIVPPGGQTLTAVAHTAGLPPGTTTGGVDVATTAASGAVTAHATTPPKKLTIAINNIPGVVIGAKSTPPPDALVIPAVASVTNFIVRYNSDICVINTSAQVMKYEINFVPTGLAGITDGQKTSVSLEPGATIAMNDIVATWFGGRTSTGTLEIRPLTEIDASTSSAPVGGLANRITFASSRTFSTTAAGGTFGQYVPAVPYANFIAKGSALSLQHIAQSDKQHTNLGLVEGSGEKVSLEVRIFDAAGTRRAAFNADLNGGERAQLNSVLQGHGLALDDARIEVEVTAGLGKVTAYASVIDNATNDAQIVPPVTLDHVGHTKWIVPGVADLVSASGNSQTDLRIFNAGTESADLTLAFYSINGGPATTRNLQLAAGEVRQLDRVLTYFALSGDAGALHITSATPAQIVATARTYQQTADGAYGQFILAVTPDEAVVAGSRPLQILQMEESPRFQSNIGFAEVSGNPVTLEVAVFRPNSTTPSLLSVSLEPNQYRQLNSLLASLGLGDLYNARISVRAVSGEGRAVAYGSLIDHQTGDPTYIPGQ